MATDNKYDRQLRIWGPRGQKNIAECHLVMLGCTGVGAETLKNLVLPGMGTITIVSNQKVTNRELGTNFFLRPESVKEGKNLAEETLSNLLEMNSDCQGHWHDFDPEKFLDAHSEILDKCQIILADNISFDTCIRLDKFVREKNKKLVVLKTLGFHGYVRLCINEFTSFETNPMGIFHDQRINSPWKELDDWVKDLEIDTLPFESHRFVPWPAILIQTLKDWQKKYETKELPQYGKESEDQFKTMIKEKARFEPNVMTTGAWKGEEENFQEAFENYGIALKLDTKTPPMAQDTFDWLEQNDPIKSEFYYMVKALQKYRDEQNCFPLSGKFPDATSDTKTFLKIKEIYRTKHLKDLELYESYLKKELEGSNIDMPSKDVLSLFVKNWQTIKGESYRSLGEEFKKVEFDDYCYYDQSAWWYWGFRAADKFKANNNRHPAPNDKEDQLKLFNELVDQNDHREHMTNNPSDDEYTAEIICKEVCRLEGCSLIGAAAHIGGLVSIEIIKIVTEQNEPFNNTFVFDGIKSGGQALNC